MADVSIRLASHLGLTQAKQSETTSALVPPKVAATKVEYVAEAVDYLEANCVKETFSALTKSLLLNKPKDPEAFMIDFLRSHSQRNRHVSADSQQTATSAVSVALAENVASVERDRRYQSSGFVDVTSKFLEGVDDSEIAAVERLLALAAPSFGGIASFYSVPFSSRSFGVIIKDTTEEQRESFVLVASSDASLPVGLTASGMRDDVMRLALQRGVGISGRMVAGCVRNSNGLEGMLLAEMPAQKGADSVLIEPEYEAMKFVSALRLWGVVLGERLGALSWRIEADASRDAVGCILEHVYEINRHKDCGNPLSMDTFAEIPKDLLCGKVHCDRVALWFYQERTDELVLNNNGRLDSFSVPVVGSVVGESVLNSQQPIYFRDLSHQSKYASSLDSAQGVVSCDSLCVPISVPARRKSGGGSYSDSAENPGPQGKLCIVQFANTGDTDPSNPKKERCMSHFDLINAERMERSVLPQMLQVRHNLIGLADRFRLIDALRDVTDALNGAKKVSEVADIVEQDVCRVMECERATIYFVDEVLGKIWAPPTRGRPQGIRLGLGEGLVGHVVSLRSAAQSEEDAGLLIINDPSSSPHWKGDVAANFVTRNMIISPISGTVTEGPEASQDNGRTISVIQVLNKRVRPHPAVLGVREEPVNFTDTDARLLKSLVKEIAVHLKRLMLDMMWSRALMDGALTVNGQSVPVNIDHVATAAVPGILDEYYPSCEGEKIVTLLNESKIYPAKTFSFSATSTQLASASTVLGPPEIVDVAEWANVRNTFVDYWRLDDAQQFDLVRQALTVVNLRTKDFGESTFYNFFLAVKKSYNPLPYHNMYHALAVVHYASKLVHLADLVSVLKETDRLAIVVGALCHDIDHRGRNAAFEVMTRSELALRYNDSSPLENHHCARAFQIAFHGDGRNNIFNSMDSDTYSRARHRLICCILATDMKHHGRHVELTKTSVPLDKEGGLDDAQGQFLTEVLLHAADLSNVFSSIDVATQWGSFMAEEFCQQADEERELGLPVTAMMDIQRTPVERAKGQIAFINYVVQPFLRTLYDLIPQFSELQQFIDANVEGRKQVVDEVAASAKASEAKTTSK
eukprot:TRINITY_DN62385_c0_g1_i1.p1 TRINITY_DN62385_c0_g1~~TRINITY_DN62385_c0_g1_i1.p1  ORF type:complete len:1089 (+),score=167.13 TRINITY_DN62385_c0_g1_i1:61-3327(+)